MLRSVNKDLDDLKSPSNRLLIWSLFTAIAVLFALNNKQMAEAYKDCKADRATLTKKNDSLHDRLTNSEESKRVLEERLIQERDSSNEQLRLTKEYFDHLSRELEKIVNK